MSRPGDAFGVLGAAGAGEFPLDRLSAISGEDCRPLPEHFRVSAQRRAEVFVFPDGLQLASTRAPQVLQHHSVDHHPAHLPPASTAEPNRRATA